MRCIGNENEPALSESRRAALLQPVGIDIGKFIIGWLKISWQEFFESSRLPLYIFFLGQSGNFTVRHAVKVVVATDTGYHVPIGRVDDVIGIPVPIFGKVVDYLRPVSSFS